MVFSFLFKRYDLRRCQTPALEPGSSREKVFTDDPAAHGLKVSGDQGDRALRTLQDLIAAGSNQPATATLIALEENG